MYLVIHYHTPLVGERAKLVRVDGNFAETCTAYRRIKSEHELGDFKSQITGHNIIKSKPRHLEVALKITRKEVEQVVQDEDMATWIGKAQLIGFS